MHMTPEISHPNAKPIDVAFGCLVFGLLDAFFAFMHGRECAKA